MARAGVTVPVAASIPGGRNAAAVIPGGRNAAAVIPGGRNAALWAAEEDAEADSAGEEEGHEAKKSRLGAAGGGNTGGGLSAEAMARIREEVNLA